MVALTRSREAPPRRLLDWLVETGFDTLLLALPRSLGSDDISRLPPIVEVATAMGLRVHLDLALHLSGQDSAIARRHPEWFTAIIRRLADPRGEPVPPGLHTLSVADTEPFVAYWVSRLHQLGREGIAGFRCKPNPAVPPTVWRDLIDACPNFDFSVWTPGLSDVKALPPGRFKSTYSSLAWWDFGEGWLKEEIARLTAVAPVANTVALPLSPMPGQAARRIAHRLLRVAAANGDGMLLPMGFEFGVPSDLTFPAFGSDDWRRLRDSALLDLTADLVEANEDIKSRTASGAAFNVLSGEEAPVAVLFDEPGRLTVANRYLERCAAFDPAGILPIIAGQLSGFSDAASGDRLSAEPLILSPGEVRVWTGVPAQSVVTSKEGDPAAASRANAAAALPRVSIEAIEPAVDAGRFAVKRVAGERVSVTADIFIDGHAKVSAALQWRAKDETDWQESPMRPLGNDRWRSCFLLERVGPYLFRIVAWPDRFATWRDEVTKKHAAGLDVTLELEEGRVLIESIDERSGGLLTPLLSVFSSSDPVDRIAVLTADSAATRVTRADSRPGRNISNEMPVDADRRAAEFASWYELFPRNQTDDPSRHGTFRDVIRRLPAIRDMGFDVLYFPPIHPIGRTNRKGRDNTMTPAEDDPGSPYAIGAAEGGHDAIHPALGSLDDFRALRDAAADHGLELALDFAIQCSPDHPWLRQHPEWFDWRPDGGLRYAENPPKKYEDIVNVDFYRPEAIPGLWLALRDAVGFWASEGVRIFRVDNPHTKPFAFWEWLIADVRATWPDAVFLAEAFTRPKVMYRLAKLGFTQSYTYFTWRNEKAEIEAYLRELTTGAPEGITEVADPRPVNVADFFRPNFFVNTPDINPVFLQHTGRPGFLIRAALATTLSGLWGMSQGFEFCEAQALPGREEYAHSDKYEIRVRPQRAPGDIVDEITRLNTIRRANPALQSHRGLAFHQADNNRMLWYRKANVDRSNVLLIAVSLDPFAVQFANVEVPLWEWELPDHEALIVDDLVSGARDIWVGKYRSITLDPRVLPFAIWRARPRAFV